MCGVVRSRSFRPAGQKTDLSTYFPKRLYDFVVVGGGTAGLALAARLAERADLTVGVLEAGQYRPNDAIIDVPKNFGAAVGNTAYDWIYATVPQEHVGGRSIRHPRGKVLGGSSAINFEMFNRPASREFSAWASLNRGRGAWGWDDLIPYIKKSETYQPPRPEDEFPTELSRRGDAYHGLNGPVKASHNEWYSELLNPFVRVMNTLGVATNREPDSGDNIGIYNCPSSVDRAAGTRSYSAPAYFAPSANKTNLAILTGAYATKINFSQSVSLRRGKAVASSVTFSHGGNSFVVRARKEIILSGGVFNTPQLLELSGIGNASRLGALKIPSVVDLPGVGENLQDHVMVPMSFTLTDGHHTWDELRNNATFAGVAAAQYAASRDGILASTISALSFFPLQTILNSSAIDNLTAPLKYPPQSLSKLGKAQHAIQLAWLADERIPQLEVVMIPGFLPTGNVVAPGPGVSYLTISPVLQHPFSRGSVHITSPDATVKPAIDPQYLAVDFDKEVLLEGMNFVDKVASTSPLAEHIVASNDPPTAETLTKGLESLKHPVGTAAIAPRELGGVVTDALVVHGTANLRVVDASVFPLHVSAHAQSTTYAIAEKAADLIKSQYP